jgi:putative membrane protein
MLWLKALHVTAMVAWFAGLFYLPRLFVYHAEATDAVGIERFKMMERRLLRIMSIGAVATVLLGLTMIAANPAYVTMNWLRVKLVLVAFVVAYHLYCYKIAGDFARDHNTRSSRWYRGFNEVPSLLLIGIVILAVVKPF